MALNKIFDAGQWKEKEMFQRKSLISHLTKQMKSAAHSQAYDFTRITSQNQQAFARD
jgi:hypothetical protein